MGEMMIRKINKCDWIIILITMIFIIGVHVFHRGHNQEVFLYDTSAQSYAKAKVLQVVDDQTQEDKAVPGRYYGVQSLYAEILEGEFRGEKINIDNYLSTSHNVRLSTGDYFIACIDNPNEASRLVTVYNYYRTPYIYGFAILLIVLVVLIGKVKGIRTVISLIFTLYAIVALLLPMIFYGYSPVLSTIFLMVLVIGYSLFLLNGNSRKTWVAVLSTSLGVILSGVCFLAMSALVHLSGYNTEQSESLILISQQTNLNISEILFAGILISCLGAVMDVGMSMASSLYEVKEVNPQMNKKELFRSGLNIGKDMIGTMCNTLILAFTGSSLTMLVIFLSYNIRYHQLMNSDYMAIEIAQGLSGTIGIVLTVPVAALLGSFIYTGKRGRQVSEETD